MKKLQEALELLNTKHIFTPGQIVGWKPGLNNKRNDGPFIVAEVLAVPVLDPEESPGSYYFREKLDIIAGSFNGTGVFCLHHYDSRRFQPVTE